MTQARVLWAVGLAMLAGRVVLALGQVGLDFRLVWAAVDAFLHHRSPYEAFRWAKGPTLPFFYPPSSLLLLSPVAMLPLEWALPLFVVVDAAAILAGGVLCLRLAGLPLGSRRAALLPGLLALFAPVTQTLYAANVNGVVLLGEASMLLAAARGRWRLAGTLLGLTCAVKPVLLPLVLLFAFERRWAGAAITLGIPLALSLVTIPLTVNADLYFTWVLPQILSNPFDFQNVALQGLGTVLGLPSTLVTGLQIVALGLAALTFWRLDRGAEVGARRLVHASALVLATTFLCASFAWGHYGVYLLPLVIAALAGGPFHGWLGLVAFYCLGGPDVKLWLMAGDRGLVLWQIRFCLGLALVLGGLAYSAVRARPALARPGLVPP